MSLIYEGKEKRKKITQDATRSKNSHLSSGEFFRDWIKPDDDITEKNEWMTFARKCV